MLKVRNKALIFYIAVIFIISFVLRYKLLFNYFVIDDYVLVINNSFISSISGLLEVLNPKNFFSVLPIRCGARPFTVASLILDYHFFYLNPLGYHLVNLLLHSINSCLLFLFCYNLKKENKAFPFIVYLFYSLHPIQTEVVNTISFRADLLLSMFSLMALNLIKFFDHKRIVINKKFLSVIIFLFVCFAFLSKENAVVLPVIIFIYVYLFYKNNKLLNFSLVTFVLIVSLFLFFWVERFPVPLYFSIYPSLPVNFNPLFNITSYLYTLFTALFYNILHVLYPVNLSVDYSLSFSKYITGLMIFFVSMIFGLLYLKLQKFINPKLLISFIIILFVINTAISYDRGTVFNNQYSLYFDAITKNPNHPRALYNMAVAYYGNKEYEKSLALLDRLSSINPNYNRESVWFITGKNYKDLKDNEKAKEYYMKAFLLAPQNQDFLDEFILMFPSVDRALYYLLNNTKTLDDEIISSFQQYQKSKNTVEVK